ncbi:hypothetical protein [Flavobacterium sp. 7A]|uniref:hypothetical protein n=1 Tax=Flavobacterium sp. 7A TaxID=2940571 RepID=UPI00222808B0|nr:hypothetical protein [Flavobacterium sp. 7A]MCW2120604.1 hypothetical protein [Flavobacterium sp. 7A]
MFKEAINDLSELKNDGYLSFEKIEFWLLKYSSLFNKSKQKLSCSHLEFKIPCLCWNRQIDCLFFDIYVELEKLSYLKKCDFYLEKELEYYHNIKQDQIKVQEWIFKHEKIGIEEFICYDNYMLRDKMEITLNNGKALNKYIPFTIRMKMDNFKNISQFSTIFNRLFFTEKINPDRYKNWVKQSGFNENS